VGELAGLGFIKALGSAFVSLNFRH
jgi:hypothetical protein